MMRLVLDGRPLHSTCSALRFHLNPLSAKLRMCAPIAVFSGRLDKLLPPPQHPVGCVIGFSLLRHKRIINTACFLQKQETGTASLYLLAISDPQNKRNKDLLFYMSRNMAFFSLMRGVYKFFTRWTNFSFLGFLVCADFALLTAASRSLCRLLRDYNSCRLKGAG